MEAYSIDLDGAQVLRWARDEIAIGNEFLNISATCRREARPIEDLRAHLDEFEREDLKEVASLCMLEITPKHAADGWRLMVSLEDEAGPRLADGLVATGDQECAVSLESLEEAFVRRGRGTASVSVEINGPHAKTLLDRFVHDVETNRHGPHRSSMKPGARRNAAVALPGPDVSPLSISTEKVFFVIVKARQFDAKEEASEDEPGSNPTDDNDISVLEDHDDDPVVQELTGFIDALTLDEQIDLVALAWVGRGDYSAQEWQDARREAARSHNDRTAEYLLGIPNLGDLLEEGLSILGFSCSEFEIGRL